MNERASTILTVVVFAAVVLGMGWFVVRFTAPPRHAERPDLAVKTAEHLLALSEQVAELNQRVAQGGSIGGAAAVGHAPLSLAAGEIPVNWTSVALTTEDPRASFWDETLGVTVALQAQNEAMPTLDKVTVRGVEARALTNGRQIAWRVSWADNSADYHLDTDRFCDAVALQFALKKNASYKMGDRDFPVQIIQWKAIWQKDIDEHFQDVQDLHPNYWTDLYWFAEGEFPFRVPDAFQRTESLDYFVAYRAGNPVSDIYREQPVQEMVAEGFGTLTANERLDTTARGVWLDGRWTVVFVRPLETNDAADYQFKPGTRDVIAIAVWDGAAENVSGRKHHSQWIAFEVSR